MPKYRVRVYGHVIVQGEVTVEADSMDEAIDEAKIAAAHVNWDFLPGYDEIDSYLAPNGGPMFDDSYGDDDIVEEE